MSGKLYVVGTPIGNLGDFSPRAVETLEKVDFIAAEDTRVTVKLLNHFGIKKEMISYYEHNKNTKGNLIIERILKGECCAIVSDAGMPAISDPGEDLVRTAREIGIEIESVPGPSALITAISISGFSFTSETMVDSSPYSHSPPSKIISAAEVTLSSSLALETLLNPEIFALVAAIGAENEFESAKNILFEGKRNPTVSPPATATDGTFGFFLTTNVRGPGVNRFISSRAVSSRIPTDSAISSPDTCISRGFESGRCFFS